MRSQSSLVIWVAFAGLLLFVALDFISQAPPKYDEPIHLGSVLLIDQYGLGSDFLRHLPAGPGPLFPIVHEILRPLTGLQLPWVRLVNPVLFLGVIFFLGRAADSRWLGINMMGSPFMALPVGLCLTEMPAMFFLAAGLVFILQAVRREATNWTPSLLFALAAGICIGITLTGRQTYIVALPALLVLVRSRRDFAAVALCGATALAFVVPLFVIWHGLVPPLAVEAETGLKPDHGLMAFAFLGLATLVIEPRFFVMPWRIPVAVALVVALLDLPLQFAIMSPLGTITKKHFTPAELVLWNDACSSLFCFLAVLTICAFVRHGWLVRDKMKPLFGMVATALILFGCIRISQSISSRYVTTALPFFLLGLEPIMKEDRWKPFRFAVAILLSAVILWSYLHGTRSDTGTE